MEYRAKTVEQAIEAGLSDLGCTREEVEIKIISEGGLFKKAAVEMTDIREKLAEEVKNEVSVVEDKAPQAETADNATTERKKHQAQDVPVIEFLTDLLDKMGLNCTLDIKSTKDLLAITIKGDDCSFAIGYRGETLDNLQFLCLLVANKHVRFKKKLVIDAEGYRELRTERLTQLSKKLAYKVAKTKTAIQLEPMNPFERRVIHTALQDDQYVTTVSEGEEPNRYVVIYPVKKEKDIYDNSVSHNFKKSGIKTRSFGQKQKRF